MNLLAAKIASAFIFVGVLVTFLRNYKKRNWNKIPSQYVLLTLWMLFALIGFGVYKQNIYDH
jgi:hypothetical protein